MAKGTRFPEISIGAHRFDRAPHGPNQACPIGRVEIQECHLGAQVTPRLTIGPDPKYTAMRWRTSGKCRQSNRLFASSPPNAAEL